MEKKHECLDSKEWFDVQEHLNFLNSDRLPKESDLVNYAQKQDLLRRADQECCDSCRKRLKKARQLSKKKETPKATLFSQISEELILSLPYEEPEYDADEILAALKPISIIVRGKTEQVLPYQ